MHRDLMVSLG
jgi:hypothetical protein